MKNTVRRIVLVVFALFCLIGAGVAQDWTYPKKMPHLKVNKASVNVNAPTPCDSIGIACYTPAFIKAAYNFPQNLDGTGQTIVIVDAFGSPTIKQDLAAFDTIFGIPDPPSFTILCPAGCPTYSPNNTPHDAQGWSLETSLDVEWAHALAPGANIVLVVAPTSSGNTINVVERAAIRKFPGSIMAQSFGIPEFVVRGNNAQVMQAHDNYVTARQLGITVLASTGDFGSTNGTNVANASFPSSDPLVTAVGGTQGHPYPGGLVVLSAGNRVYGDEEVWNEPAFGIATGGSYSLLFPVPSFQNGLGLRSRTVPDVSMNAAVNGGVLVLDSAIDPTVFFIVGGTSASVQEWGAIVALANQYSAQHGHGPLGYINPAIYSLASTSKYATDFHDITIGNNALAGTTVSFFIAARGYDLATGWGTPNVSALIPDLVSTVFP